MTIIVAYAFVFVSVLLLADTVFRLIFGSLRSAKEINARMERLKKGADQFATYTGILNDRGIGRSGEGWFTGAWFRKMYLQTGLQMKFRRRLIYVLLLFLSCWVLATLLVQHQVAQFLLASVLAAAVLILLILRIRSRRIAKFVSQLPPTVDIIVRSLSAGHPLNAAISLVGREMPDPIGSEFGILSDQLTFGSELDDAMHAMIDRVGADELNLLAITMSVQRGTGGNLAEILENLSGMIRDRSMLRAKIRAISAEGRITAVVMAAFPAMLYLMISALVPTYFDPVWETGYGTTAVISILAVMGFGIFILNRLVNFDF